MLIGESVCLTDRLGSRTRALNLAMFVVRTLIVAPSGTNASHACSEVTSSSSLRLELAFRCRRSAASLKVRRSIKLAFAQSNELTLQWATALEAVCHFIFRDVKVYNSQVLWQICGTQTDKVAFSFC